MQVGQRERRATEEFAFARAEQQTAVFALFDGDVRRAVAADQRSGFDEIGFAGEHLRLGVVEDEQVHPG